MLLLDHKPLTMVLNSTYSLLGIPELLVIGRPLVHLKLRLLTINYWMIFWPWRPSSISQSTTELFAPPVPPFALTFVSLLSVHSIFQTSPA